MALLTTRATYGSRLAIESDNLKGIAVSSSPKRVRSYLPIASVSLLFSSVMPRTVFKLGTLVKLCSAVAWSCADIPANCWDKAEVRDSLSLGAILKPSKKLFKNAIRPANSGPLKRTLTSWPFSGTGVSLPFSLNLDTSLVLLPPTNSATESRKFLTVFLNCTD